MIYQEFTIHIKGNTKFDTKIKNVQIGENIHKFFFLNSV